MRKLLILPLMFICMMFAALAYTVIDTDNITYIGDKSVLLAFNWRNSTTADGLSYCFATTGDLYCADGAGFGRGIHHLYNAVNSTYCVAGNYTLNGGARNFSQRYTISMEQSILYPVVSEISQFGFGQSLQSTPPNDMKIYLYANSSGNTKICLRAGASEVCPYSSGVNNNHHNVQIDYDMDTLPTGAVYVRNATLWVNGVSGSLSGANTTNFNCINSSMVYFRRGISVYNLSTIVYNDTDTSYIGWNTSLSGSNVTYECNDGIDNDGDTFIDGLDAYCDTPLDNSESPATYPQCMDSDDNDGDMLTDLQDPECDGDPSNNDESPINYYQCNDGNDNDADGLVDYGQDPSCTEANGTTEFPAQNTVQIDDLCSLSESCIIKTTFPYSDSIYFHDWKNNAGDGLTDVALIPSLSKRGMRINNYGLSLQADLERNFTNGMSYDLFNGIFDIHLFNTNIATIDNHILYFALQDNSNKNNILFEMDVDTSVANQMPMSLYLINSTGGKQAVGTYDLDSFNYYASITFQMNNLNNTITINGINLPYSNLTTPSKVRIFVDQNNYDSRKLGFYFSKIQITGQISTESICTNYAPPYYLKEDFNYGYLSDCAWAVNPDLLVNGKLQVDSSLDYFYGVKSMYDTKALTYVKLNNRFTTVTFSYTAKSTGSSDSGLSFFVYDYPTTNIVASFSFEKNGDIYSYPNGNPQLLTTITPDSATSIKIVFDLTEDTFKFYVNNGLINSAVQLQSTDFDYQDIYSVYLTSSYSDYDLDSLYVFTSDANGTPLLSLGGINIKPVQNTTYLWGIIYKSTPNCVVDSDCPSGQCTGYGKCASLNYKMCDEYGYNRTNWCFFKLIFAKSLDWVVNMIIDNFLLFLGLLIILMFFLFLWGHLRGR